jgi:electron-transferring-flavoprotein dehydrogenase
MTSCLKDAAPKNFIESGDMMDTTREQIPFDVLFVGGGPANLAGALHLLTLAKERNLELEVALIEKGPDMGAHALSGAVLNPIALKELIPDYLEQGCPIEGDVRGDAFYYLTQSASYRLPFVPGDMRNEGFHIISLSRMTRWLADLAEAQGLNIFPGFSGQQVLFAEDGKTVVGVRTGDQGLGKNGEPKSNFEPGIDIMAKVTVFGEGVKGSLVRELSSKIALFEGKLPQTFETGIKEVIQLPENHFFSDSPFNDIHTLGYPVGLETHGGGFIYEMKENRVSIGLVLGLGYEDPMIDIYDAFIQFKRHPLVEKIIAGGQVMEQGARALGNGGFYTIPKLATNGAMLVGATASMLNAPALKGIHTAMKSGMLAAESIIEAFAKGDFTEQTLGHYETLFNESWLREELYKGRNFAQAASRKMPAKLIHLGAQFLTNGRGIINRMSIKRDCDTLRPIDKICASEKTKKPVYDGTLFLDKLTGVYMSKTQHREDQPCHLIILDEKICIDQCYPTFRSPCTRFCPGDVYAVEKDEKTQKITVKLNPSNCLHCKTCEIKDPFENITWTCPEGGGGPKYTVM